MSSLPTIPAYYRKYVDPSVDLDSTPHIPCTFHNEQNGKSFSYSHLLGKFRCFGACHCGGDVIDLHRLNYKIKTREDAKIDLYRLYNIPLQEVVTFERIKPLVSSQEVHRRFVYNTALSLATTPDDWIELDYIVQKVPYDVKELEVFCSSRGVPLTTFNEVPTEVTHET